MAANAISETNEIVENLAGNNLKVGRPRADRRMLTIGGGRIVDEIQQALGKLGYASEIRIVYAEDYGVPQTRRRAFIAASRIGPTAHLFPAGTHGPVAKPSERSNRYVHRWKRPEGKRLKKPVTVWQSNRRFAENRKRRVDE